MSLAGGVRTENPTAGALSEQCCGDQITFHAVNIRQYFIMHY